MTEHQIIEWKESWKDDYLKWIAGFANAQGGTLVIGRTDAGVVVGAADAAKLLVDLPNKIRDVLGIVCAVNLRREQGRDLVEIVVEPYPYPISYRGQYHLRSGSTKQELKGAALDRFLLGRLGRNWDGVPVPQIQVKDLDTSALANFRRLAARSGRVGPDLLDEDNAHLLERLHLTDGGMLKRAAWMLFHADPERIATGAIVKIGFFRNDSDLLYHDVITGDLFTQVEKTIDVLQTKYLKADITYEGLQRVERFPVPPAALRETITNAIAHKDYASGTPIQIRVLADRLVSWNPGHLPEGWTIERLLAAHPSHPANPDIANAFFRAGAIESWDRGLDLIRRTCRDQNAPEPIFAWDAGLRVEFPFAQPIANEVTPHVTPHVAPHVAPHVERLLSCLRGEMDRPALQAALGLADRESFRRRYLQPALKAGLIAMTHPDTPKSVLQRYRLTEAGIALRDQLASQGPQP